MTYNAPIRIVFWLFAPIFILAPYSAAQCLECGPLEPNKAIIKEIENKLRIEGEVVKKLIGSGELEDTYKLIESDILSQYPNADNLHIWKSFIYLACTSLDQLDISDKEKLEYIDSLVAKYHAQSFVRLQETFESGSLNKKIERLDNLINSDDEKEAAMALQLAMKSGDDYLQTRALHYLIQRTKSLSGTWKATGDSSIRGVFGFIVKHMEASPIIVSFTGNFTGNSIYFPTKHDLASGSLTGNRLRIVSKDCALDTRFNGESSFTGEMTCHFYSEKGRYNGSASVELPLY